ncbi:MAG: hypothetical protein ACKO0V_14760, partial [bacterium]
MKPRRFYPQLINNSLENRLCLSSMPGPEAFLPAPATTASATIVKSSSSESSANDAMNGSANGVMPQIMVMVMKPTTGMISENESITGNAMATGKAPALLKMRETAPAMVAMPVAMVPQAMPAMPVMTRRASGRRMPEAESMLP